MAASEESYSLNRIVIILGGELTVIHCLSDSSAVICFFSKKGDSSYALFQRYFNYFYRILAASHYFNGTMKQISYRNSYISEILKRS